MQCQTVVPEKVIEQRNYFGVGKEFEVLQNYRIGVNGGEPEKKIFFFKSKCLK